ncbi:MAG: Holliday junction branch migration protein RuvA [Butyrivibrio sp.]|nr:Holliday junction branch migration protein RuvA [Butyrivibrio sp.]
MIAYLNGTVESLEADNVVVDVNGIGYNVMISVSTADRMPGIGEAVKIYTYTCVREDAFNLYGFLSRDELNFFKMLISVSGIGPKGGLGILSVMSPDDLRFAILAGDSKAISRAPGVGKKTAERLVLELHDKISAEDIVHGSTDSGDSFENSDISGSGRDEAVAALVALGYSSGDSLKAVRKVISQKPELSEDTEAILKLALKELF